jgi:hypothetical protein
MRITIHLDTFDCADPAVYAILWLDSDALKWSREGHAAIDIPVWGRLEQMNSGTRVVAPDNNRAACVLDGLDVVAANGPFEGESGRALWYRHAHHAPIAGKWHVQCVDDSNSSPENSVFADDEV